VNSNPSYDVQIRFSTLSEYFDAVASTQDQFQFSSYDSDFFPYADGGDAYWTGYFTSRPYLKAQIRQLESSIRHAEMLLSFSELVQVQNISSLSRDRLLEARQAAGLLLHHDAITGTSRHHVMDDYKARASDAIKSAREISAGALDALSASQGHSFPSLVSSADSLVTGSHRVVVSNPLGFSRTSLVCVHSESSKVLVLDMNNNPVQSQLDYHVSTKADVYHSIVLKVCWIAQVPALGFSTFFLISGQDAASTSSPRLSIFGKSILRDLMDKLSPFEVTDNDDPHSFSIENSVLVVKLDPVSAKLLQIVNKEDSQSIEAKHSYLLYRNNGASGPSGAYIFRPGSEKARDHTDSQFGVVIVKGPIFSRIVSEFSNSWMTTVTLVENKDFILKSSFKLVQTISAPEGVEVTSNIDTDIDSNVFWSHNGFSFVKRKCVSNSEHFAASFYPSVAGVRVQSLSKRLTLYDSHSHSVSCSSPGNIEMMLHRNLVEDDERGMAQAARDHTTVKIASLVIPETRSSQWDDSLHDQAAQMLSAPVELFLSAMPEVENGKKNCVPTNRCQNSLVSGSLPDSQILFLRPFMRLSNEYVLNVITTNPSLRLDPRNFNGLFTVVVESGTLNPFSRFNSSSTLRLMNPDTSRLMELTINENVKFSKDNKQNSDEEGVFISDIAKNMDRKGMNASPQRSLLKFQSSDVGIGIKSFILTRDSSALNSASSISPNARTSRSRVTVPPQAEGSVQQQGATISTKPLGVRRPTRQDPVVTSSISNDSFAALHRQKDKDLSEEMQMFCCGLSTSAASHLYIILSLVLSLALFIFLFGTPRISRKVATD